MSEEKYFKKYFGADSKFVYYEDLQNTYPSVYRALKRDGNLVSTNHSSKMLDIASTLRRWSAQEAQKEIQLLREYFNISNLNLTVEQMYTDGIGREITEAINTSMQLQSVYKRHLTRILGPEGRGSGTAKITGAQFFADYFSDELGKLVTKKFEELDNVESYTFEELGEELFSDEIINNALYQALFVRLKDSGDWAGSSKDKSYQELFTLIESFNKNGLMRQISQVYHLEELKDKIMNTIRSESKLKTIIKSGRQGVKASMKTSLKESTLAKGTLAEIFAQQGFAAIQEKLRREIPGVKATEARSEVVGGFKGKADILTTFGLDFSKISEVVEKQYKNRGETVAAYKKLNDYLNNVKSGFVVYTNAKDYSLIKETSKNSYFFSGFSAGSAISLRALEQVISNTPGGSRTIIGQIMSTMEGAVYSDLKTQLEEELCEKMAYFLFDDVLTIGKDSNASKRVIHLLMLDGIYIPLSYLFFLMARAIEDVDKNPDEIFKINITPGEIEFKNGPWLPGMWAKQKETAYEQIKIGATFLKSFVNVIREMH